MHELMSAYAWTCMVLVVTTALLRRGSWTAVLALGPLLLGYGLWTLHVWDAGVVKLPVPPALPEAGLRASLGDIYWPSVELSPGPRLTDALADIWKPDFLLGYALAYVVLERAARLERWPWLASVTLAGLVGFLGLLSPTLVPVVLIAWAGLALAHFLQARRIEPAAPLALRLGAGPILGGLLLLGGGGPVTGLLDGSPQSGLTLAQGLEPRHWYALGSFDARPGGLVGAGPSVPFDERPGGLGLGPLAVAAVAVALARRDRLVVALAAGAGLLVLAWIALTYPPSPWDLNRLAGHARNLALVAVMLALATRLTDLRSTRRRFAVALVAILVTWPTVVMPARSLGLAIGNGVQLANASWVQEELIDQGVAVPMRRYRLPSVSGRVADYIRAHTPVSARVLAPEWPHLNVLFATGRPNNAGFAGAAHLIYRIGPEYLDVRDFLEPAAVRRLGLEYVYVTDDWQADLPDRAVRWLADPRLFELLIRDGAEALYRVRPAFLQLDVVPHPQSYEALRAVPPSTVVYLAPQTRHLDRLLLASVLSHARLLGSVHEQWLHFRSPAPWTVEPLGEQVPDLVALPALTGLWTQMFPSGGRQPVWQNGEVAIYAPHGGFASIAPPSPPPDPPPVQLEVTDVTVADDRIEFVASFEERASEGWTSQDWVVLSGDRSPWAIPTELFRRGDAPTIAKWFGGLLSAGSATTTHTYRIDVRTAELSVRNDAGAFVPLPTSAANLVPGGYTLALRWREEYQPNYWRDAAVIPVVPIRVAESGEVLFEVFDDVLGGSPLP